MPDQFDELFNIVMDYVDDLIQRKKVMIETVVARHPYLSEAQKDELRARLFLVNIFKKEYIRYQKQIKKDMDELLEKLEKQFRDKINSKKSVIIPPK